MIFLFSAETSTSDSGLCGKSPRFPRQQAPRHARTKSRPGSPSMADPAGIVLCAVGRSSGLRSDGRRVLRQEVAWSANRIIGIGDRADRWSGLANFARPGPADVRTARLAGLARLGGLGATAEDGLTLRRAMLAMLGTADQAGHDDGRQHQK